MSPVYIADPSIVVPTSASGIVLTYEPDFAAQLDEKPRLITAQFGEGYQQNATEGLNPISQKWTVKFGKRTSADKEELVAFFRMLGGSLSFTWTIPDSDWSVTNEQFGTGNGTRQQFQLQRQASHAPGASALSTAFVPCKSLLGAPQIYKAGALLVAGTDYTINSYGLVTFTSAPASGAALTFTGGGDDTRAFLCKQWTPVVNGFNNWDISATFEEVFGT